METLKIVCSEERYLPKYANETDACMDLKIVVPEDKTLIAPYTMKTFSTGCKFQIPEGKVMLVYPRSSTGFKFNCMLANTTGIVDAGYRDEVKLAIFNYGDRVIEFEDGQRVAQMMILNFEKYKLELTEDDENFRNGDRKGGIGSTGK